ncbi:MAG TPA: hypothetical protein PLS63_05780 [Microthrixaceae bacterium]|nr:hypothetical protein [Microthrixaceae bacterium]
MLPQAGTLAAMPMQESCKFFESRTYPNGETVRKCDLDMAPEAPWRCPDGCPAYTPRLADVNWAHGTLVVPPTPPEPSSLGEDSSIASLLDEAEDIVNAAGPRIRAEVEAERPRGGRRGGDGAAGGTKSWKRFFRRKT